MATDALFFSSVTVCVVVEVLEGCRQTGCLNREPVEKVLLRVTYSVTVCMALSVSFLVGELARGDVFFSAVAALADGIRWRTFVNSSSLSEVASDVAFV